MTSLIEFEHFFLLFCQEKLRSYKVFVGKYLTYHTISDETLIVQIQNLIYAARPFDRLQYI